MPSVAGKNGEGSMLSTLMLKSRTRRRWATVTLPRHPETTDNQFVCHEALRVIVRMGSLTDCWYTRCRD